jgi:transposase
MSLGKTPKTEDLFRSSRDVCEQWLSEDSIYRILHREGGRLFADEAFADLFAKRGRHSIPPQIVAVVMVLQRIEGLSDREAVERCRFDLRWKYAAGGLDFDYSSFVHTVVVGMRARLRNSDRPNRIFEAVLQVAKQAGLVGRKRVLDSTALYDAVATQDTVTLIRSAIRGLLRVAEGELLAELRCALKRDDDYMTTGKPVCDWEDQAAREALVDALARDGYAMLSTLDGQPLNQPLHQAAELLATVLGQDLQDDEGRFRIARRVARDRVISTVDSEARHGHKTSARGFDGYKGHIALDPDSEIITATEVTAGNASDAEPAESLLEDMLDERACATEPSEPSQPVEGDVDAQDLETVEPAPREVYGDACYGTADMVERLESADIEPYVKVQPPSMRDGKFAQDKFDIDRQAATVRCPAGHVVELRQQTGGALQATFAPYCSDCPLRDACTCSKHGRTINVHPKHETLHRARQKQSDPEWNNRYQQTRPKVERKLAHMMRRRHGGRRARVRGRARVGHDFALLAAAVNLQRLAALGVSSFCGERQSTAATARLAHRQPSWTPFVHP